MRKAGVAIQFKLLREFSRSAKGERVQVPCLEGGKGWGEGEGGLLVPLLNTNGLCGGEANEGCSSYFGAFNRDTF